MNFSYRPYKVTVSFKNEGAIYGAETYTIMAQNEDQAERKALVNATGSQYDDERIPDRKKFISDIYEVDEADGDQAEAA